MRSLLERARLITVDLDDTLWPCGPVIGHAEATLYDWLAVNAPSLTADYDLDALRIHRKELAEREPERAHNLTWLRHRHLSILLQQFGYAPDMADEGVEVFRRARNQVNPFGDVIPVLEVLHSSHVLVSLTNGNVDLDETPLGCFFEHHIDAVEAGAAKPDPAMFQLALDRVSEAPGSALHLGDDPVRDIAPAMAMGMGAVWVNRAGATWPQDLPRPDGEIKSLGELL